MYMLKNWRPGKKKVFLCRFVLQGFNLLKSRYTKKPVHRIHISVKDNVNNIHEEMFKAI